MAAFLLGVGSGDSGPSLLWLLSHEWSACPEAVSLWLRARPEPTSQGQRQTCRTTGAGPGAADGPGLDPWAPQHSREPPGCPLIGPLWPPPPRLQGWRPQRPLGGSLPPHVEPAHFSGKRGTGRGLPQSQRPGQGHGCARHLPQPLSAACPVLVKPQLFGLGRSERRAPGAGSPPSGPGPRQRGWAQNPGRAARAWTGRSPGPAPRATRASAEQLSLTSRAVPGAGGEDGVNHGTHGSLLGTRECQPP